MLKQNLLKEHLTECCWTKKYLNKNLGGNSMYFEMKENVIEVLYEDFFQEKFVLQELNLEGKIISFVALYHFDYVLYKNSDFYENETEPFETFAEKRYIIVVKIDSILINVAFTDLKTALSYVNSNGFFHNQVNFKTTDEKMVFSYGTKEESRAVEVDFNSSYSRYLAHHLIDEAICLIETKNIYDTLGDYGVAIAHEIVSNKLFVEAEFGDWNFLSFNVESYESYYSDVIRYVEENGLNLRRVDIQTAEICLAAVKENGLALEFVQEQNPEICMAAVKQNAFALEYVQEQTLEVCVEAIKNNIAALCFVKNQTPELCMKAFEQNPKAVQYFKL